MAGEVTGKMAEAAIALTLELIGRSYEWNNKDDKLAEPDFKVGGKYLLVTVSGSAKESNRKAWRNIGEMVECNLSESKQAPCIGLSFGAMKTDIATIQDEAMDAFIWFPSAVIDVSNISNNQFVYGPEIYSNFKKACLECPETPSSNSGKLEYFRDRYSSGDRYIVALIDSLITVINGTLDAMPKLTSLWHSIICKNKATTRSARHSRLRRGLGKLLLLGEDGLRMVNDPSNLPKNVQYLLEDLGYTRRFRNKVDFIDKDILWAIKHVPPDEMAAAMYPLSRTLAEQIEVSRSMAGLSKQHAYLIQHYDRLLDPRELFRALKECYDAPWHISPDTISKTSRWVWLFHVIIAFLRFDQDKRTEFGIGTLIEEISKQESDRESLLNLTSVLGRKPVIRSKRTVELGLTDWYAESSNSNYSFTEDDLARVALVLSAWMSKASKRPTITEHSDFTRFVLNYMVEVKIVSHKAFRPLDKLLIGKFKGAKRIPNVGCLFNALAKYSGSRLDPRSGGTSAVVVGNSLFITQSAHEGHCRDKRKEINGRLPAISYNLTPDGIVTPRPDIKKYFLFLDGDWADSDIDMFYKCGWDEVFFPDEIDDISKIINSMSR